MRIETSRTSTYEDGVHPSVSTSLCRGDNEETEVRANRLLATNELRGNISQVVPETLVHFHFFVATQTFQKHGTTVVAIILLSWRRQNISLACDFSSVQHACRYTAVML